MTGVQTCLFRSDLSVLSALSVFLVSVPVFLLVVLLGVFKLSGDKSAFITACIALITAVSAFKLSPADAGFAFLYGTVKAVFPILIIIIMAIFSYNVLERYPELLGVKST